MNNLVIPCKTDEISDGYHTFGELYAHRVSLFAALMVCNKKKAWMSKKHDDGSGYDGWFIAGIKLPTGDITYHLPDNYWGMLSSRVKVLDRAPKWDGHTPTDVINRLDDFVLK